MFQGLNRKYAFLPLGLSAALLLAAVVTAIAGQARLSAGTERLRSSFHRDTLLREYLGEIVTAESAQRGYLLTHDDSYLNPYRGSRQALETALNNLLIEFEKDGEDNGAVAAIRDVQRLAGEKLGVLDAMISLERAGNHDAAIALAGTNLGEQPMTEIRAAIGSLEQQQLRARAKILERAIPDLRFIRLVTLAGAAINIALVLLASLLIDRAIQHRFIEAQRDASDNERLQKEVLERTGALSALSSHLQHVSEQEKSQLARELHDELGGLLIAVKIDLTVLRRSLPTTDLDIQKRWDRALATLDAGLRMKRRVVEELRPTLLDNMGLYAALRWQLQETCGVRGLKWTETLPEHELPISSHASIAIFRVAQEALTNILRHSEATEVDLTVEVVGGELIMRITDNGIGASAERMKASGGHGLAGMQHRVQAFAGTWSLTPGRDGHGSVVEARLPLKNIQIAPA